MHVSLENIENNLYIYDSSSGASIKIELIHYDFCVLVLVPSINGNKYLMYFIDDYTNMCRVYLLKLDKSRAFEKFKSFHMDLI